MKTKCLLILLLSFLSNMLFAQDSSLIKAETEWIKAINQNNITYIKNMLTDDFKDISWEGKIRTKQDLLNVKSNTKWKQELSELNTRIYNHSGVVNGINSIYDTQHTFIAKVRFTDIFIKKKKQWKAISAQETLIKQ